MRISDWSSDVCSSDLDHDPARIALRRRGRIDADYHAHRLADRVSRDPASLDQRARPQRALDILEKLAVQFLPPEPRAAIKPVHRRQTLRRQIVAIVTRATDRRFDALFPHQPPPQRTPAPGRRTDLTWDAAEQHRQ